ncbi:cellular nucleic acid-binding protein, partial [Trifolium medium]|nr:cellular nucleic acid-binding protein [Trifolium medium]
TKARICDEDGKAKSSYYKALNDKRKRQDRAKLYGDEGKRIDESSGGRKNGPCYKCGLRDHISYNCPLKTDKCFNGGKLGHKAEVCRATKVFCFKCGEEGHKSPACRKPRVAS